jgi:hypothetical protein
MAEAAAPALGGELPISDQTSKEVSTQSEEGGRKGMREGELLFVLNMLITSPPPPHPPAYTHDRKPSRRWGSGRHGTR